MSPFRSIALALSLSTAPVFSQTIYHVDADLNVPNGDGLYW